MRPTVDGGRTRTDLHRPQRPLAADLAAADDGRRRAELSPMGLPNVPRKFVRTAQAGRSDRAIIRTAPSHARVLRLGRVRRALEQNAEQWSPAPRGHWRTGLPVACAARQRSA